MPTTVPSPLPDHRRRGALRALLAAVATTPPHSAVCLWLAPCGPWLSYMAERRR